jgi:hypothetical protein
LEAGRCIHSPCSVVIERLASHGCIPNPASQVKQGSISLGCVVPRIASIGRWAYRVCFGPESRQTEGHEK